ncbi:shikimate kinase [Necator americanus]|uniref:Gluconokinase n=1 Tax=Necator americanus TaxID=51031 RepID=W2T487_NECAM|nr:shikimate kinase [Necator americanus]ETN76825.1 shikimate kinase [Necator americanus]
MNIDVIFVMGVSGCGKTTVGHQLAVYLGWNYKDGDDFHSEANVAKMSAGIPLTDDDRRPWLRAINTYCRSHQKIVVGCSALKKQYRDILKSDIRCRYVFLDVSRKVLERRLKNRKGHYMPATLLDSQLATLERPDEEEDVIRVCIEDKVPVDLIEIVVKRLNEKF